ncbi:dnaJ homolog subfamily C member 9 [Etheostoma cragini]|uniref:dnaJ homolog subfamily C member 9 n=1 Tax=Etheostoma cragini TaxID=417921 RepID=UPI00155EF391|nr:dnaJ homolog subfamily C member 9 [Etheostoma cragini]
MGLLERCQELFKTSNLYEVLGINKEATETEIRRSYYKVSLKVHPDRAPEDPLATEKFQVLGKLYAVLSDKEQRVVYNEQGVVDEESNALSQDRCWEDYWRLLFPKITLQDILEFENTYKGSDEERQDVIQLYVQHQGNMDAIIDSAMCCSQDDEPRLCSIIQAAIQSKEVTSFPAFTHESEKKKKARRKRANKEREEAEEMQKEMGLGEEDDSLVMMLKQKQKSREQNFNSFLSDLEAKYSKKSGKSQRGKRGKK